MTAEDFVECTSKAVTGGSPLPDLLQPEDRGTTKLRFLEVLVCDRVPPMIQFLEKLHSRCILGVVRLDFVPEIDPQTIEVRIQIAGLSIATIQSAIPGEFIADQRQHVGRGENGPDQVIDAFGMKIATKPLELGRQQHGVSLIELLGVEPPTAPRAADGGVARRDLVQRLGSRRSPVLVCDRGHPCHSPGESRFSV
ncbi:MAG TPA: hypothetical protein VFF52_22775 [Isosphaeraceae bacterium]|nr:hypothetical protein [Isosphaeraceae bacterium]